MRKVQLEDGVEWLLQDFERTRSEYCWFADSRSTQAFKTQILSLVCDESQNYRAKIRKIWELEAN